MNAGFNLLDQTARGSWSDADSPLNMHSQKIVTSAFNFRNPLLTSHFLLISRLRETFSALSEKVAFQ
jgi:hypothetical protein